MAPKRRRIAVIFCWIALWQLLAMAANGKLLLPVPTPVDTARALWRLGGTGSFWLALGASAARICAGFAGAVLVGTAGAVLAAKAHLFALAASPLLNLVRAAPVASVTILVFLWLPRQHIPTFIAFLTVLPIVWGNVSAGIRQVDRQLLEMARVFGMGRRGLLRHIALPAIRPHFTAAVATGVGFAWKSGVAAEIICRTPASLGDLLWRSKSSVAYDEVFALTAVIILWSVVLEHITRRTLRGGRS